MHHAAALHLAHVPPYVPGRMGQGALVSLASNENPDGPAPEATAAAMAALVSAGRYPIDGAPALAAALAASHGLAADHIRVTNGATEAITLLCRAFVGEVVVTEGTFPAYARAALAAGSRVRAIRRRGWHADLDAMRRACGPDTRLVFLANPDNPTGTAHGAAALSAWLRRLPRHVVVVIDEAYIEYTDGETDALELMGRHPNLVVLRSFSKAHALAAFRVGWLAASREIAAVIDRVRDPFNTNTVGTAAALGALRATGRRARVAACNAARRQALARALEQRGLRPVASQANFLCLPVGGSGAELAAALANAGVGVRPLDAWGIAGAIRITVGSEAECGAFLRALDACAHRPPAGARSAPVAA